jgi:hypothetical protein
MESAAKPEVILQAVAQRPPARLQVHQLNAALHHVSPGVVEASIDEAEQLRVHVVLSVENTDDVAQAVRQGGVHPLGLVLRHAVIDHDTHDVGVSLSGGTGDRLGSGVIMADDRDHLVPGVIELSQPVQGGAENFLLVTRGNQEREREVRLLWRVGEAGGLEMLRSAPGVQHPSQRGDGNGGEGERQQNQSHEPDSAADGNPRQPQTGGASNADSDHCGDAAGCAPPRYGGDPHGLAFRCRGPL